MRLLDLPSQKYLAECLDYDKGSGTLTWKVRPVWHFKHEWGCALFNRVWAGKKIETTGTRGYKVIGFNGVRYNAHRVIWKLVYGEGPIGAIDHINGDTGDNRLANLRSVTNSQNSLNSKPYNRSMSELSPDNALHVVVSSRIEPSELEEFRQHVMAMTPSMSASSRIRELIVEDIECFKKGGICDEN